MVNTTKGNQTLIEKKVDYTEMCRHEAQAYTVMVYSHLIETQWHLNNHFAGKEWLYSVPS